MRHDEFRRRQAGHDRHHHVHGDNVGAEFAAQVDRLAAVLGFCDHLEFRVAGKHVAQAPAHGYRILRHEYADSFHLIALRMQSSRSVWSNLSLTM